MAETTQTQSLPGRVAAEFYRYELTLSDYWRILIKRRWVVVVTFFLTLIASIIYTNTKTPLYEGVSVVRITSRPRHSLGTRLWSPYTWEGQSSWIKTGRNRVTIRCTNTLSRLLTGKRFNHRSHRMVDVKF